MTFVQCKCLFDITNTGVYQRHKPVDLDIVKWTHSRNTQSNFDTVIQLISLRAQPIDIFMPEKSLVNLDELNIFGSKIKGKGLMWSFQFKIEHADVFNDDTSKFGLLYQVCDHVPMILTPSCSAKSTFLDISVEYKNIHFE